ncbi:hypothetical protein BGW42_006787 [Actinomortierella wolfii]|nr:hypothetical protein BGW42_006787 [Actinomortierella wolfii]
MKSARFNEGFVDRDLIEMTKIHPALDYVSTSLARTAEPASALGLSTSSTGVKDDLLTPQQHINSMPRLPLECIDNVMEWVENRQDLLALMTVSKDVFLIAARHLYRNPIKSNTNASIDSFCKLVLLLLSVSPASGGDIDIIRRSNNLPPPGSPLNPQPTIDYLSLVKVVRWREQRFDDRWLWKSLGYNSTDLLMQMTWAFVGHRLDEVEEIEIDAEDRERYLANAARMTHLRRIWIHLDRNGNYEEMYEFSEAMIKAIQLHHGPHQLLECQVIPNPLVKDGTIVTLDHPLDPYASAVQYIDRCDENTWNTMMRMHAGHPKGQIIQRFRGMTTLCIYRQTANGNDENLLDWAACEAENSHHKYDGRQFAPLIRLEELSIDYKSYIILPQSRTATPKWKILQDGLLGFASTLNKLKIVYPQSRDGMTDRVFTTPRTLPKLKSMNVEGLAIDRSFWEQAPDIEELYISFDYPQFRDSTTTPDELQDDQITEAIPTLPTPIVTNTTATTTTGLTTEQQIQRQIPEFWFYCPRLTQLTLKDRAANLLDPNCFHFSPNLEKLMVSSWTYSIRDVEKRNALKMLHPTQWTWDWSFPVLHSLTLTDDLHEFKISMGILRSCPTLKSIYLYHCVVGHRFPLHVKGDFDASMNKSNNQKLPFTHGNLTNIRFHGFWDIGVDELACLLRVLPDLKELDMGFVRFDKNFGDRELVEITKVHPSLEYMYVDMALTAEPPSASGLSTRDRGESSDICGKDDRETPKERTRVTYAFRPDLYALHKR